MENPKNQLATKLKDANNVLVTVSTNPTVDQLSAAIGLTLFLTKLKKHATTVFSGQIPSTIDFLKPEEAIETNTDSLRDFIISLDKNKADKIRYKVEDTMVKIFITPYRTSITEDDLIFSQGDFNVDVVVALGIQKRDDIDQAIMTHGRILHDATVATVNLTENTDLGTLNWTDPQASSLCEMMVALTDLLKANSLDGQMATALLTGIVAETERFSNEKTSSTTMNASAKLMAAGANQQLVATKLQPPEDEPPAAPEQPDNPGGDDGDMPKDATLEDDGSLRINHQSNIPEASDAPPIDTLPEPWTPDMASPEGAGVASEQASTASELHIEKDQRPVLAGPPSSVPRDDLLFGLPPTEGQHDQPGDENASRLVTEPPQFGGQLTAAAYGINDAGNPLNSVPHSRPMLSRRPKPQPDEPPKPVDDGPPEPYTVFEPQPAEQKPEQPEDAPITPPVSAEPKANLPQAAEPAGLDLPTPPPMPPTPAPAPRHVTVSPAAETAQPAEKPQTGHSFADMGDKTLADIERKVEGPKPSEPEQPPKKVEPEEGVDYKQEALKHVAKVMSTKTIDQLEEKVGHEHPSEEKPVAKVVPAEQPEKEELSALKYEAHESEPAEKSNEPAEAKDEKPDTEKESAFTAESKAKSSQGQEDHKADSTKAESKPDLAKAADKPAEQVKPAVPDAKPATKPDVKSEPKKSEAAAVSEAEKAKQDEARDAVMRAISAGGDGRTSPPPLEAVGTAGAVEVNHDEAPAKTEEQKEEKMAETPPPVPPPMMPQALEAKS